MDFNKKIAVVVGLSVALYMIPSIKTVYDDIIAIAIGLDPGMADWTKFVLHMLPFVLVAALLYGIIETLFKKKDGVL